MSGYGQVDADPLLGDANSPPRKRYKSVILSVCSFILVTEMCERLAYYGLVGSLTIFFTANLGMDAVLATQINSLFSSINYITPLVGAWLADTHWGRYKTILYFCFIYLIGMAGCTVASYPGLFSGKGDTVSDLGSTAKTVFLLSLFLGVALGSGGIKPNVVTLGADQFDLTDPDQVKEKDRFFNYFYWAINIGATFAYAFLAQLAVNGMGSISSSYGFFASFLIPACAMALALCVFIYGTQRYIKVPPEGSALSNFFKIFVRAGTRSNQGRCILGGCVSIMLGMALTITSYFLTDDDTSSACAITAMTCIALGVILIVSYGQTTDWFDDELEAAKSVQASKSVQDAAEVCRLLPYLCFLIMFWACYGQMSNNFILQGCKMNLHWGASTEGGQMSSAFLNVFDSAVIILFIPLFDMFVYPFVEKTKGSKFTVMQKIGTGFIFCFLAMTVAGLTEIWRKSGDNIIQVPLCCAKSLECTGVDYSILVDDVYSNTADCIPGNVTGTSFCNPAFVEAEICPYNSACAGEDSVSNMAKLTVWAQIPQYLLVGTGEIFTSISSYELFYSQVPPNMRSVCQALNLLTTSIGFMVTGGINSVFKSWIPADIDDGTMEYVFFVVAGLTLACFFAFTHVARGFQYKDEDDTLDLEETLASGLTPDVMKKLRNKSRTEVSDSLKAERRRSQGGAEKEQA